MGQICWEKNSHFNRLTLTVEEKIHFSFYILDFPGLQPFDKDMDWMFFCIIVMTGFFYCSSPSCNDYWNTECFCYWALYNYHMSWPRVPLHLHIKLDRSLRSNHVPSELQQSFFLANKLKKSFKKSFSLMVLCWLK